MRKFIISMIAAFGVIALGLILLMMSVIRSGGIRFTSRTFGDADLVKTTNLSMENISSLSLEYSSDDIIFIQGDTEELVLKEYMNITPKEEELTQIKKTSSEIRFIGGKRHWQNWGFNHYYGYVEVYLPTDYQGSISPSTSSGNIEADLVLNLAELNASCTSGDLEFNEVYAEDIRVSASSGNITFAKAEGNRSFATTSGDIEITGGNGDTSASSTSGNITIENGIGSLSASASSGNITVEAMDGKKDIETTSGEIRLADCGGYTAATASSGNIEITELAGAGDFASSSGNIEVSFTDELAQSNEDIQAEASSGEISLELPASLSFNFKARTSSGDIDTFFDDSLNYKKDGDYAEGTIGPSPAFNLDTSTTSGNITIEQR
jgi:DUF4097 and DUF4098 domain-containing protein YvlB